jgi:hypothetical protein
LRTSASIAQRGGAEHDPLDAERQPIVDRGAVANAAAELDPEIDDGGSPAPPRH